MKKYFLSIAMIAYTFSYCQIGVGTPMPTAMLDIQSKTNTATTKALEINNSAGTEVFAVFNNGDVEFKGALMPDNNPGISNQYLISKGSTLAPQWKTLDIPVGTKQIQEVFEIVSNGNSTSVPANTWRRISLNTINLASNVNIGTWNAAANEFTVNKNGLYMITAGNAMFTNTTASDDSGKMRIYSGSSFFEYGALTTQCSPCSIVDYTDNSNGEIMVNLNTGDKIWIEAQTTVPWVLERAFMHIKYVEL